MTKQNIFKAFGFLALSVFAVGILFLSVKASQVQAHDLTKNGSQMMGHMVGSSVSCENHNRLTPEQKKEMVGLMKQHHGKTQQNHHQRMHGSSFGI